MKENVDITLHEIKNNGYSKMQLKQLQQVIHRCTTPHHKSVVRRNSKASVRHSARWLDISREWTHNHYPTIQTLL